MYSVIRLYGKMPIQCSDIFCTRYLYWLYDGISPISPKMFTQSVTWRVTNCHVCYQDKGEILTVMSPRLFFHETLQSPTISTSNGNWQCSVWYRRSSRSKFCTNVVESSAQALSSSHNRGSDQRDNVHL